MPQRHRKAYYCLAQRHANQDALVTIGVDFSGVVVDIDPSVTHVKKGDRVAGAVFPTNRTVPNAGVWAEYALAKADGMVLLDNAGPIDDARGASLGVGLWTAYVALYKILRLPLPGTREAAEGKGGVVLVCGGATCAGMWMIQLAKLSGCRVVATAAERNFALLKELGADAVVDYGLESNECVAQILAAAGGQVPTVVDCVSADTTTEVCDGVMAKGAKYYTLTMSRSSRDDVETVFIPGQLANGESFVLGGQTVGDDYNFGEGTPEFLRLAERLMQEGKIRPPKVEVCSGWDAVLERMKDVQEGKLSAMRYVVDITGES